MAYEEFISGRAGRSPTPIGCIMPLTPEELATLDDYRHMMGADAGGLALALDQLTDVMAMLGQHKVHCRVEKGPRGGTAVGPGGAARRAAKSKEFGAGDDAAAAVKCWYAGYSCVTSEFVRARRSATRFWPSNKWVRVSVSRTNISHPHPPVGRARDRRLRIFAAGPGRPCTSRPGQAGRLSGLAV